MTVTLDNEIFINYDGGGGAPGSVNTVAGISPNISGDIPAQDLANELSTYIQGSDEWAYTAGYNNTTSSDIKLYPSITFNSLGDGLYVFKLRVFINPSSSTPDKGYMTLNVALKTTGNVTNCYTSWDLGATSNNLLPDISLSPLVVYTRDITTNSMIIQNDNSGLVALVPPQTNQSVVAQMTKVINVVTGEEIAPDSFTVNTSVGSGVNRSSTRKWITLPTTTSEIVIPSASSTGFQLVTTQGSTYFSLSLYNAQNEYLIIEGMYIRNLSTPTSSKLVVYKIDTSDNLSDSDILCGINSSGSISINEKSGNKMFQYSASGYLAWSNVPTITTFMLLPVVAPITTYAQNEHSLYHSNDLVVTGTSGTLGQLLTSYPTKDNISGFFNIYKDMVDLITDMPTNYPAGTSCTVTVNKNNKSDFATLILITADDTISTPRMWFGTLKNSATGDTLCVWSGEVATNG
jgi:hypothetical protein